MLSKVGVPLTVKRSPEIRSSLKMTEAVLSASYVLFDAAMATLRALVVMFAVVVAVVFCV